MLTLTDPILSLAWIGIVGAIWLGRGDEPGQVRRSPRLIVVAALTGLVGISPWLVRNYRIHGEFVAIKSTFGYAFWQGNCALSEGTDKVLRKSVDRILERGQGASTLSDLNRSLWEARHEAGYLDDIALTKADYRRLGSVAEPERSRILFRRALADLQADPWRYPRLCLRRLRYFILFDETNPKSRVWAYRVAHLGLSVFAIGGLLLAGPVGPETARCPRSLTAAAITLFHTLTIVSARFHHPPRTAPGDLGCRGVHAMGARSCKTLSPGSPPRRTCPGRRPAWRCPSGPLSPPSPQPWRAWKPGSGW